MPASTCIIPRSQMVLMAAQHLASLAQPGLFPHHKAGPCSRSIPGTLSPRSGPKVSALQYNKDQDCCCSRQRRQWGQHSPAIPLSSNPKSVPQAVALQIPFQIVLTKAAIAGAKGDKRGSILLRPVHRLLAPLLRLGYQYQMKLLNSAHYGVPQNRWVGPLAAADVHVSIQQLASFVAAYAGADRLPV